MTNKIHQTNLEECQKKFGLSYHVNHAYLCEQLIGFSGKDVLEVGGSLPPEFVFDYLQVQSWSGMETPDYAENLKDAGGLTHKGTIITQGVEPSQLGFNNRSLGQYNLFLDNIENLDQQYYENYDLIFSTSAFEHINKFSQALEKMFLALRPGGQLFSVFSPIWSAFDGHHLPMITDKNGNNFNFANSPIPPWGHLLMTPPQMTAYLADKLDKETTDLMVYYIYNSPHINRFFTEDYLDFVKQSNFIIKRAEKTFINPIPPDTQILLQQLHPGRKDFNNNGLLLVLEKPLEKFSDLNLNSINLIIFPNWSLTDSELLTSLSPVFQAILKHPQGDEMTILIETNEINEEKVNLLLSDLVMNILLEDELTTAKEPVISLLSNFKERDWQNLLPKLQGRIIIAHENRSLAIKAIDLPAFTPAMLSQWQFKPDYLKTL